MSSTEEEPKNFETQPKPEISPIAEKEEPLIKPEKAAKEEKEIPKKAEEPREYPTKADLVSLAASRKKKEAAKIPFEVKVANQERAPIPNMKAEGPADGPLMRQFKFQKFLIATTGAVLGMALTLAGIKAFYQSKHHDASMKTKGEAVSLPPTVPPPAEIKPPTPQAVNPELLAPPIKKPQVLKIFALKTTSTSPHIGLETDLPPESQIKIHIWADTGAILKYPSFSLYKTFETKAGELPSIDLTPERLPRGNYHVSAKFEDLLTATTIAVGPQDDDLKKKLGVFRKQIEKQQKAEKESLRDGMKFVAETLSLFNKAASKVKTNDGFKAQKALKEWEADYKEEAVYLEAVTETKHNNFVYPEELLKLKSLEQKLRQWARTGLQNQKAGRDIAADKENLDELTTEFQELQNNIKELRNKKPTP